MPKKRERPNHYFSAHPKSKARFGIIRTYLRGRPFEFLTASGVFSKKRVDLGTRLLIESMMLPEEGYVLDIGCGYGAVGIVAAAFNPNLRVIMADVNKRAVRLAKENIRINNVHNAEVRRGRLYEPAKDLAFNCILSNPPVSAGMETVRAIIAQAQDYMTNKAYFQIVVRSKIGGQKLRTLLEENFANVRILARKSGYRVLLSEKQ
jgi:16S rRNA (guanine1207-N2)-methyltransferase